jgi:hypothetical protein
MCLGHTVSWSAGSSADQLCLISTSEKMWHSWSHPHSAWDWTPPCDLSTMFSPKYASLGESSPSPGSGQFVPCVIQVGLNSKTSQEESSCCSYYTFRVCYIFLKFFGYASCQLPGVFTQHSPQDPCFYSRSLLVLQRVFTKQEHLQEVICLLNNSQEKA